jgi:hypothetical protein
MEVTSSNSIKLVSKFISKIEKAESKSDKEQIADLLVGMNRAFRVMSPDEKVTVLNWLIGELIRSKHG